MAGLSIIVPTRNEQDNIDPLMERLLSVVLPAGLEREILFIDDSSEDDTRGRIEKWCASEPVRLICRDEHGGLAGAVVAGAREARHELVVVMDADLSHPPESIPELVQPLIDKTHHMVIGSRYVEGGAIPQWPAARKIASRLACLPARLFSSVNDPMAGFFATDRQRLAAVRADVPGFKIGFEVLATAEDGFTVKEIPIVFRDRFEGFSKMSRGIVNAYGQQLVQLCGSDDLLRRPMLIALLAIAGVVVDWSVFFGLLASGVPPEGRILGGTCAGVTIPVLAALFRKKAFSVAGDVSGTTVSQMLMLLVLILLGGSVQGAVYHSLLSMSAITQSLAFIPAACCATVIWLAASLVITGPGFSRLSSGVRLRFAVIAGIGSAILLRGVYLGLPELMEQEAYYWNYAQHPALSYLDHPPMVAVLIRLGTFLFGTTEFGVRIGAFGCWFLTVVFIYRLTERVCGRSAALGSVLLLAILPYYFGIGLMMTPDAPLHAAWAATLYYLYRALVDGRSSAWLGVGIGLGLGLLSKYTIALVGPAALLFMLIDRWGRKWFSRPQPYGAFVLAVLLFLPVLLWNYQHDWVSFLFQSEDRLTAQRVFTTHRLLGYIGVNLTPAGLVGLYFFLTRGKRLIVGYANREQGVSEQQAGRSYLFLLLMTIVPLSVFLVFSLTKEVKLNWTSPVWLAVLPVLGATVMRVPDGVGQASVLRAVRTVWVWTVGLLIATYAAVLYYVVIGIPGLPFPSRPFLVGWQDFAARIETILDEVERDTGSRPVVVGMDPYQISSGLAFYRAKNSSSLPAPVQRSRIDDTVGWHLFTWDGLMYEFWSEPSDLVGRDVLVVATSKIRVEYPYFRNRVISMGPIREMDVTKDGSVVRPMFYRLVRGYRIPQS